MTSNQKTEHVSRVNQLDAEALDGELFGILKKALTDGFLYLNSRILTSLEPEINALLRIVLWKLTIFERGSTIGQNLLNLKYINASTGLAAHWGRLRLLAISEIGLKWLNDRLTFGSIARLVSPQQAEKIFSVAEFLRLLLKIGNVINFLAFLRRGKFKTLEERLIGVRSGNASSQTIRQVQYEYMNRELLWHGFADFLIFALPLVNVQRIKNVVLQFLLRPSQRKPSSPKERTRGDLLNCALCSQSPIRPHDIGCRHVFCYTCIASNVKADPRYTCPICLKAADTLESVRPVTTIC